MNTNITTFRITRFFGPNVTTYGVEQKCLVAGKYYAGHGHHIEYAAGHWHSVKGFVSTWDCWLPLTLWDRVKLCFGRVIEVQAPVLVSPKEVL